MISIQKRGKVYQYRFEAAKVNGKRKWISKSGFKTKNAAFTAGQKAYEEYQNKGSNGVDGITVFELKSYMEKHMETIKEQIRLRKYKTSPVRKVYIPKDNGDKRGLGIPTVIDRVIQQAIVQVLTPIYEEQFSSSSYGFRPRRSCEMAVIKLFEYFFM